jgi:hypothetical protein
MPRGSKLHCEEGNSMSRDAKSSIILWTGTLAFVVVFWAFLHFNIGADIPDRWLWPMVGIVIGANVVKSIWDYCRRRNAKVR